MQLIHVIEGHEDILCILYEMCSINNLITWALKRITLYHTYGENRSRRILLMLFYFKCIPIVKLLISLQDDDNRIGHLQHYRLYTGPYTEYQLQHYLWVITA